MTKTPVDGYEIDESPTIKIRTPFDFHEAAKQAAEAQAELRNEMKARPAPTPAITDSGAFEIATIALNAQRVYKREAEQAKHQKESAELQLRYAEQENARLRVALNEANFTIEAMTKTIRRMSRKDT